MSKYLSASLIIMALIFGIGIGYLITPEYRMVDDEMNEMGFGKADKNVDLRYMNSMIGHHESAMVLAKEVKDKTKRKEIKELAETILENEPKLIKELYEWKKDWYKDTSKVDASEVPNLGSYDEKLDLRFLNALIAHHEAGIDMAEEIKGKSSRNEVLNNADVLIDFLSKSSDDLMQWRKEWYGI